MDIDRRRNTGAFYTPKIWVDLSHQYLKDTLGVNWQDEYYIWDCAAGTGNLLEGLKNPENIWASTLEFEDVETMKERSELNLLEDHIFQFDFLNDDFDKIPSRLFEIISNKEKREKLIILINPPFAEVSSGPRIKRTKNVLLKNEVSSKYKEKIKYCTRELYIQFLIRIYSELEGCFIAVFSKIKNLVGLNYKHFRQVFQAKILKMFLVPSSTFCNIKSDFLIGFCIFNTSEKEPFSCVNADVYNNKGTQLSSKRICNIDNERGINDWIKSDVSKKEALCQIRLDDNFISSQRLIYIVSSKKKKRSGRILVHSDNFIDAAIYYSIKHSMKVTWLNERDFLRYPNNDYEKDSDFKSDCIVFFIFNNNLSSTHDVNHFIPFRETEVGAQGKFESSFVVDFIKTNSIQFSKQALMVLNIGRELYKYYHKQKVRNININASIYDIKELFQGRDIKGKMNNKSNDNRFNEIMDKLKQELNVLRELILQKGYKYGFIKKE